MENAESHFDRFFFFVGNLRPDRSRNEYILFLLFPFFSLSLSLSPSFLSPRVQIRPVTLHNTYFVESFSGRSVTNERFFAAERKVSRQRETERMKEKPVARLARKAAKIAPLPTLSAPPLCTRERLRPARNLFPSPLLPSSTFFPAVLLFLFRSRASLSSPRLARIFEKQPANEPQTSKRTAPAPLLSSHRPIFLESRSTRSI